jgi:hypothetical protein
MTQHPKPGKRKTQTKQWQKSKKKVLLDRPDTTLPREKAIKQATERMMKHLRG